MSPLFTLHPFPPHTLVHSLVPSIRLFNIRACSRDVAGRQMGVKSNEIKLTDLLHRSGSVCVGQKKKKKKREKVCVCNARVFV